jgi:hypothetical protein
MNVDTGVVRRATRFAPRLQTAWIERGTAGATKELLTLLEGKPVYRDVRFSP